MASGHTRGVRHETGSCFADPPRLCKTDDMRPIKNNMLTVLLKTSHIFSLHSRKTIDIKPIGKITVPQNLQSPCALPVKI